MMVIWYYMTSNLAICYYVLGNKIESKVSGCTHVHCTIPTCVHKYTGTQILQSAQQIFVYQYRVEIPPPSQGHSRGERPRRRNQ